MSVTDHDKGGLSGQFGQASDNRKSNPKSKSKAKETRPFSIRLTEDEKAYLKAKAGRRSLGAYCRAVLLEGHGDSRKLLRHPTMSDSQYAALLAALGQSHLSSNLNQLAKHANTGTLDVSQDIEQELHDAYGAVLEMRKALFIALGLKPGEDG